MRVGKDIAERLMDFAVAVVKITENLPRRIGARHVAVQLVRAATSGGANYEEGRAAESRDDFIHKLAIAHKEVRESYFWLEFMRRCDWPNSDPTPLVREASELSAILGASLRTARTNK